MQLLMSESFFFSPFLVTDSSIISNYCIREHIQWWLGSLVLSHNYPIYCNYNLRRWSAVSTCCLFFFSFLPFQQGWWTKRTWTIMDTVWLLRRPHLHSGCWGRLARACSGMAPESSQSQLRSAGRHRFHIEFVFFFLKRPWFHLCSGEPDGCISPLRFPSNQTTQDRFFFIFN